MAGSYDIENLPVLPVLLIDERPPQLLLAALDAAVVLLAPHGLGLLVTRSPCPGAILIPTVASTAAIGVAASISHAEKKTKKKGK